MTSYIEFQSFLFGVIFYLASSFIFIYAFIFQNQKLTKTGFITFLIAFAIHSVLIISRWVGSGHPPVMRDYENAIAGSWVVGLFFILFHLKAKSFKYAGMIVAPVILLMFLYCIVNRPDPEPLTPGYKSNWLLIHVVFAWLSYGSFTISFALGILYLIKEKRPNVNLPDLSTLDSVSYRFILAGFLACTVMIVSGSIWASKLWGTYWNWDPVETWSFICWIAYGIYIHLRIFFGLKGRIGAYISILALFTILMAFWGVNFLPDSLHIFKTLK